jgi:5-methylcytosine-specific restriction enzyme A
VSHPAPSRPLHFCPGKSGDCRNLVASGLCEECAPAKRQQERRFYTGTPGVNYGRRWQRQRRLFLERHPFCVDCEAEGKLDVLATDVDHDVPHRGDARLFWDESNWRGRCEKHHGQKTARETLHGEHG